MRVRNDVAAGLLLGFGAMQFLIAMVLGESIAPAYSMHNASISDLGTLPSTRILFNASLILFGVCNLSAGYFVFRARRSRLAFALFAFAGAGAIGAGLVPLDSPLGLHSVFALLAFLFVNLEVILAGRWTRELFEWLSLGAGTIGLLFTAVMVLVDSGVLDPSSSIGHGGVERMIVYPALIWMLLYGGRSLTGVRAKMPEPIVAPVTTAHESPRSG